MTVGPITGRRLSLIVSSYPAVNSTARPGRPSRQQVPITKGRTRRRRRLLPGLRVGRGEDGRGYLKSTIEDRHRAESASEPIRASAFSRAASCRPNPIPTATKFAYGGSRDSPMEIARGANAIKRPLPPPWAPAPIKRGFFSARTWITRERCPPRGGGF